jgi:glycosyltransferase involved in cell wall biosynthesis
VIEGYGSCQEYVDSLNQANVPVHILLPGTKQVYIGHKEQPFRRILNLFKQSLSLYRLRSKLIDKVCRIDPDVIWMNGAKSLFLLGLSWRLRKYPLVVYAHRWFRREEIPWHVRWLMQHRVDGVLAVSQATSQAIEEWPFNKEKIHVVYHTIDFEKILKSAKDQLSGDLPGIEKCLKILVPGDLLHTKGQHTAIEAAHYLKEKGMDLVMWLAGDEGVTKKKDYVHYLRNLITDYGLEENIFILGWRNDVPSLMNLSDIVVFPTHSEGLGRVIEEAMLLKKPVISTPAGGVTDLIIDSQTGLLGPIDDAMAIANNVEKLLSDNTLLNNIIQNAYQQMFDKFSPERHIELVRAGLISVIGGKQRRKA